MTAATPGIAGRVFSVTGGASGMGAATVQLLAAQGASTIWIADWNTEKFDKVIADVAAINPLTKVHTNKVDVSDAKQVNDWVSTIIADSRILHGAANVAGLSQPAFTKKRPALLAQDDESWDIILGVNLHGIMYCTRAQVRAMIEIPAGNNPAIVNVSSLASLLRGPTAFAYGVSKAACAHFTACVAKDLYSFGIRANTVSPGNTFTPMTKEFFGNQTKEETEQQLAQIGVNTHMLNPNDVARIIVWLLSEASLDVNGVNIPVGEGAP